MPPGRLTLRGGQKGASYLPRMSRKRREEWSFFLNHRNRITYNDLCRGCTHDCKQSFRAVVVLCPHYQSKHRKNANTSNQIEGGIE